MIGSSVQMPVQSCPTCAHRFDAALSYDSPDTHRPKRGDVSVCIACGTILVYSRKLALERMTFEDLTALHVSDPDTVRDLSRLQDAIRKTTMNAKVSH